VIRAALSTKSVIPHEESWWGAYLPFLGCEPVSGQTTRVHETRPRWRQTLNYLHRHRASPPLYRYRIILIGDKGICVRTTCPRWLRKKGTAGNWTPRLFEFRVQRSNNYTVSQKQYTKLLLITSTNVNRFSKFFHWQTQWKICNKFIFQYPTTP